MTDSIKRELEALEEMGRISARDQREVHADFGFESITREEPSTQTAPAGAEVTAQLDDAWSRLKRRIGSE